MSIYPPTNIKSAGSNTEKKKPSASIAVKNDGHSTDIASLNMIRSPCVAY